MINRRRFSTLLAATAPASAVPGAARAISRPVSHLLDLHSGWYVEPNRRDEFVAAMDAQGRVTEFESEVYRHRSGERIWVSETAWTVASSAGELLWYEGTVTEITERKRAEAAVVHSATHDGLTGLPNRSFFVERLREHFEGGNGAPDSLALLYLDLDRFKAVNDTMGHPAGDALLRQVAVRIQEALGVEDVAARIGGDEFVVIQVGAEQPGDAEMLAQHLLHVISRPFFLDGRPISVGLSVGIAIGRERRSDADQFLIDADIALYQAKDAGRQTYRVFEPGMDANRQDRRNLELDLRGAIARSELLLHFQPQIALDGGHVTGFEALVRWAHPIRGLCPPDTFIPLAEVAGLIVDIGDWVLRTACAEAMTWPSALRVAVNVSALQFASGNLCPSVIQALASSKLPPERLELEITESVLLASDGEVTATLNELRSFGVRIALDDFGTGFSSLGYLRSYRFDKIKIDRSFVRDIGDPGTLDIVRAIVSLGRSRAMIITAEGVETAEQLAIVSAEGCSEAQGYVISRPIGAEDVCQFLLSQMAAATAA